VFIANFVQIIRVPHAAHLQIKRSKIQKQNSRKNNAKS